MATKKIKGSTAKSPTKKPAVKKSKAKARAKPPPAQIWQCIVDGWVRYRGTRHELGDTILVQPEKMSEKDLATLQKYFKPIPTEVVSGISEPVELLDNSK